MPHDCETLSEDTKQEAKMRRLCETVLTLGLATSLVLTGCGAQGGGDQPADAGSGTEQATAASTSTGEGTGGGSGTGGTSSGSETKASATELKSLEGWWKTTSVKSDMWELDEDALTKNQGLFESAGALTINSNDSSFALSSMGGNLSGSIRPTEDEGTFELAYDTVDGFTGIKGAECKVIDDDHLQIVVTEDTQATDGAEAMPFHITIDCQRTNEFDSYDSVWDCIEELHVKNRDAVMHSVPIESIDPMLTIGESEDGYVGLMGRGETDTDFCLVLLFSTYRSQCMSVNGDDLTSELVVNGNQKVKVKLATVLPGNSKELVDNPDSQLEGRAVLVKIPKAAVGGQLSSFSGTADITTLDRFPVSTLEFSHTF